MTARILEQVANALRANTYPADESAWLLGRGAARTGGVIVALDEEDRRRVFDGARAERAELGMPTTTETPVVACVMPWSRPVPGAESHDPAREWPGKPLAVTPRAILAAFDEAQSRLEAARLREIEGDEALSAVAQALDNCGVPRVDSDGRAMDTATRARVAANCASRGWRITDVRIMQPVGQRARIVPLEAPPMTAAAGATSEVAALAAEIRELAGDYDLSPPGQVPIADVLRRLKTRLASLLERAADHGGTHNAFEAMYGCDLLILWLADEVQREVDPDAGRFPPSTITRYVAALREGARRVLAGDLPSSMRAGPPREDDNTDTGGSSR